MSAEVLELTDYEWMGINPQLLLDELDAADVATVIVVKDEAVAELAVLDAMPIGERVHSFVNMVNYAAVVDDITQVARYCWALIELDDIPF